MTLLQPDPGSHYTAWSSMGTLINKGLVARASCPAKWVELSSRSFTLMTSSDCWWNNWSYLCEMPSTVCGVRCSQAISYVAVHSNVQSCCNWQCWFYYIFHPMMKQMCYDVLRGPGKHVSQLKCHASWFEMYFRYLHLHRATSADSCFKDDSVSHWKSGKFDPHSPKNSWTDRHQNLHGWFCWGPPPNATFHHYPITLFASQICQ